MLVRKPDNQVFINAPCLLAETIGNGIGGLGGVQMFIDACADRVEELFRKRREDLKELEHDCLLRRMYEAADRSKWPDTLTFVANLDTNLK